MEGHDFGWIDAVRERLAAIGDPLVSRDVSNPISTCTFFTWKTALEDVALVVKRPTAHALKHSPKHLGALEYRFYDYGLVQCDGQRFSPDALFAAVDEESGDYIIVLRDEGQGRFTPPRELPPSIEQLQAMVEVLAHAHKAFSGRDTFLATSVESFSLTAFETRWLAPAQQHLPVFLEELGSRLTDADGALAQRVVDGAVSDQAALLALGLPLTIVHTDPNPSNYLLDVASQRPALLLDWQSWRPGIGVQDLAFLLSQFFPPALRQRAEPVAFAAYANVLSLEVGALETQYKLFLSKSLLGPVLLHKYHNTPAIWWPQFYRALQTCWAWQ